MKFAIATLGCKVNAYESQGYAFGLNKLGYEEVDFKEQADIYIINTCTVTNTAASKSRQKINHAKKNNPNALICIVGCFVQTDKNVNDLDVDVLIGSNDKNKLPEIIDKAIKTSNKINDIKDIKEVQFEAIEIDHFTNKTRAFIKIQDGCNQYCSYCIIPYARGKQRSMPLENIISQANKLVDNNHKEIVLTGIHTGRYGEDINSNIVEVIKELIKIDKLERIRLSSIEINEISDELIELMANNNKIANHLHIPIQSACNTTLKMMNRPYTVEYFIERVNYIRSKLKDVSISTDIILGFPNEKEEDYLETINNLSKINFSFMHIFPFSKRDGTKACELPNHLSNSIKKDRCHNVSLISKKGYDKYKHSLLNKQLDVLFEYFKDGYYYGHSSEYVEVKVKSEHDLHNEMFKVKINNIEENILVGELEE